MKQTKEERREARESRHKLPCPHCGKTVLDHMTQCPYCGGKLTPRGYNPPDEKKMKTIKIVCWVVGFIVAIGIILIVTLNK